MPEVLINNVESELAADAMSGDATIEVLNGSPFPLVGNYRVRVNDEIMIVTSRTGSDLSVTRGAEGTTPASHTTGDRVVVVLTKGSLEDRISDFIIRDDYASKPAAGTKGRLFLPSDGIFMEYDDGAAWHKYGPIASFVDPPDFRSSPWVWVNKANTWLQDGDGYYIFNRPHTTTNQYSALVKPLSAPFTITACFSCGLQDAGVLTGFGLALYDNTGSDDAILWGWQGGDLQTRYFTASTGQAGTAGNYSEPFPPWDVFWLQIEDDSTDRHFRLSLDGINFVTYLTEANTTHVTTNCVGLLFANAVTGKVMNVSVLSWDD